MYTIEFDPNSCSHKYMPLIILQRESAVIYDANLTVDPQKEISSSLRYYFN